MPNAAASSLHRSPFPLAAPHDRVRQTDPLLRFCYLVALPSLSFERLPQQRTKKQADRSTCRKNTGRHQQPRLLLLASTPGALWLLLVRAFFRVAYAREAVFLLVMETVPQLFTEAALSLLSSPLRFQDVTRAQEVRQRGAPFRLGGRQKRRACVRVGRGT